MKTKSERLFEEFLATNNLPFEKIEENTTPRPDYLVSAGGSGIVFELKELAEDENFGVVKDPAYARIKSSSRTLGDHTLVLRTLLVDAQGKVAAQQEQAVTVGPASVVESTANVAVPHPHLWLSWLHRWRGLRVERERRR